MAEYYLVTIPPNPQNALFSLVPNQGEVDLYVRNDYWPTTNSVPSSATNDFPNPEFIGLDPTSTPIPLTAGDWYITVIHPFPTASAIYDLYVSVTACPPPPLTVTAEQSSYSANGFSLKWNAPVGQVFDVQYTDTLSPADWKTVGEVRSDSGQFEFLDPSATNNTSAQRFYRLLRVQ